MLIKHVLETQVPYGRAGTQPTVYRYTHVTDSKQFADMDGHGYHTQRFAEVPLTHYFEALRSRRLYDGGIHRQACAGCKV